MSAQHGFGREGIDYDVDQPLGWYVRCLCGETFYHCAPEGAHDALALHIAEASAAGTERPGRRSRG